MANESAFILRKAKAHIENPEMWFQGGYSVTGFDGAIDGKPCCALGALAWATKCQSLKDLSMLHENELLCEAAGEFIGNLNDRSTTTHAEIMAVFDRAINLAERG